MKTIVLFAAALIAGAVRQPAEGPITVSDDDADRIVENLAGEVIDDDEGEGEIELADMTLAQLKKAASAESVDLGDATTKAAIAAAIEAHRAG